MWELDHKDGWVIFHCIYVPQFLYPFICWWISRLLLPRSKCLLISWLQLTSAVILEPKKLNLSLFPLLPLLFTSMVSESDNRRSYGHSFRRPGLPSPHTHSRQATLHTAHDSVHRLAGSYLIRTRSSLVPRFYPSSHKVQVSTETGSYAPCHCRAPGILNPQHPP